MWTPLPGRFKDYIAMPKPNMYQSLHTTVVGPSGDPLEIQIRTLGDAPHERVRHRGALALQRRRQGRPVREQALLAARAARMAEGHARLARVHGEPQARSLRLAGLRLLAARRRLLDARPAARRSTSPIRCTPTSAITASARRSTAASFRSTTRCRTATSARFSSTSRAGGPSLDWLSIVKTSSAKHKIKQWFRKEQREENVLAGQEALEAGAGARGRARSTSRAASCIERIASRLNYATPTDLFAAIGFGDASAQAVANRFATSSSRQRRRSHEDRAQAARCARACAQRSGVRIAGVDDVLVRLSKCCSPVPGDPIIGYVTIGRGVSVHRADCPNVAYMNATPERILQAQWIGDAGLTHASTSRSRPTIARSCCKTSWASLRSSRRKSAR